VERLSIAFADHSIVANHLWCRRVAGRCGNPEKCSPIRNYPLPKLFHPAARNRDNDRFLITYPGTLNAHQGVDVAIRAFAKVSKQMPDADFHIYGEGPAKTSLINLADSLGMSDRVFFHHFLLTEQIAQVMANTDLAVEPKLSHSAFGNEALSMKILEFMAVGVPVVASRTKIHQFYYDESLVEFYDADDYQELAAKILLLRRAPARRQELIRNSLEYVKANNWDIEKKHYLNIVDSLSVPRAQRLPSACSVPSREP
jgi:glycosyltransferase involved in cell wall biosynthesis